MKTFFVKAAVPFIIGAMLLIGILLLKIHWTGKVDFSDNPALLVQISETGTVTLDTYNGRIVAPLEGVKWKSNSVLSPQVRELLQEAQREKVAFKKSKNGGLHIWFVTESGSESLNDRLSTLFSGEDSPIAK